MANTFSVPDMTGPAAVTECPHGGMVAVDRQGLQGAAVKIGNDEETPRAEVPTTVAIPEGMLLPAHDLNSPESLALVDKVLADGGPEAVFRDEIVLDHLAALMSDADHNGKSAAAYGAMREKLKASGVSMRHLEHTLNLRSNQPNGEQREAPVWTNGGFFVLDGCICRTKKTSDGPVPVPLCNFAAEIVEEITLDDGQEQRVVLGIEGKLASGRPLPRKEVSPEKFAKSDWIIPAWGSDPIVWPGEGRALPAAIQAISQMGKARRTVYCHTGWTERDGAWIYVHAKGAIGQTPGAATASVDLQPPLTRFALPAPVTGDALSAAVRASLRFLDLADVRLTAPVLAAVYRAPLGGVDFSLHVAGPTGVFKSELAALAQQHYGREMNARHLPGSWSSTDNSLEMACFLAKDAIFVVDDYAPHGSCADVQRLQRTAERLFRAQGNLSGRQRLNSDCEIREAKPPRGLILSTGEDIPPGQSLRARLLILEVGQDDIHKAKLTACQRDAEAGLYAQAMASYLAWLAPTYDQLRNNLPGRLEGLRAKYSEKGMHARTPEIAANLMVGFETFLRFAEQVVAIDESRRSALTTEAERSFRLAAEQQAVKQEASEPARHFLRTLESVFASQRAHAAGRDGGPPENPAKWGWRQHGGPCLSKGDRIGWVCGDDLYLDPGSAYAAVVGLAKEQNEQTLVSAGALWKRLKEKGFLASVEAKRGTLTVRKVLDGAQRAVLHLKASSVLPDEPDDKNPTSA